MSSLPLSNIVNVSIAAVQTGVNAYNTGNLAIFTDEYPDLSTFGSNGYAIYLSPTQVATDFGSSSKTYKMANAAFSQQPNMLNAGGSLIVILLNNAVQHLALSGVAASGSFEIVSSNGTTAAINWDDTAAEIQTKLQAITGQSGWLVTGSIASQSLNIRCAGTYGPVTAFTVAANSLQTGGSVAITFTITTTTTGETIDAAITRTANLVQYFGLMVTETLDVIGQTDLLAAAAVIQPLLKIGYFVSHTAADIAPGGMLDLLRSGGFTQTRGLYYGDSDDQNDLNWMAGYAAILQSTNFSGSNSTITMNLKQVVGSQPDVSLTQTQLNQAKAAGADTYPSLQGVPGVISSGENMHADQIFGQLWLAGAIQVAGFNYLATVNTKIPQTEGGMDGLKASYRGVLQQAVVNQFCAPGTWNSGVTFGNQQALIQNIAQYGFYIYSVPVSQQSQTDRVARKAPLVSIAAKLAGAIQSSSVIVYINA